MTSIRNLIAPMPLIIVLGLQNSVPSLFAEASAQSAPPQTRPTVASKPVLLDWKSIQWKSLNYGRTAIDGGAALFTLPSPGFKRFRVDVIFPGGVFHVSRDKRPSLGAAVDLMIAGGIGNRSPEQVEKLLSDNAISGSASITRTGEVRVTFEALTSDFALVSKMLEEALLSPRWDAKAFKLWQQEKFDSFEGMLDGSNSRKQNEFINQEMMKLAFGNDHYGASNLKRMSKQTIEKIQLPELKLLHNTIVNRSGMLAILSGDFTSKQQNQLMGTLGKVPKLVPPTRTWMPDRVLAQTDGKLRIKVIRKADMSQANINFKVFYPNAGKKNELENAQLMVLEQIFSSTGGVVGNDRFSKVMRADSGISYSPHAAFEAQSLAPNTNMSNWKLTYQSPNERILESVKLATQTLKEFIAAGVTNDEIESARISKMNQILATEKTVFDDADRFVAQLLQNDIPNPQAYEATLAALDNQKNIQSANPLLTSMKDQPQAQVMVIMGNPSEQTMADLAKLPNVEVMPVVSFDTLVSQLGAKN